MSTSTTPPAQTADADSRQAIDRDLALVGRMSSVPSLLKVVCRNTGMGFAAVARVTDGSWTACAVQDDIGFGLQVGGQLDVNTTLCVESRAERQVIVIDEASKHPVYASHHTPRIYNIESYISVPIVRPDGRYFGNLCAIDPRPRVLSDERTVAMFTSFADLIASQLDSEEQHLASELALQDERAVADLREEFIAVLGHDLRNPLASVSATAEILLRRADSPEFVQLGQRLRTTSRRMSGLIDDVLDFARGRLGSGIGVSFDDIADVGLALQEVVSEFKVSHPERSIRDDDIAPRLRARADQARLQQLVSNLVGNALAHGDSEAPVVVSARADGPDLVVTVANQGEPISPENLPNVFRPYWRPKTSKPGGGLGLGLYICAQIARAHGGEMTAASSAEDGTRFSVRLPILVAPGL